MNLYLLVSDEELTHDDGIGCFLLGRLLNRNVNGLADLHRIQGSWANVLLAHSCVVGLIHAAGGTVAADEEVRREQ